jgi:hypothetical protein
VIQGDAAVEAREAGRMVFVREGRREGYPECCVQQYATEAYEGLYPAKLRGRIERGPGDGYVPCSMCLNIRSPGD